MNMNIGKKIYTLRTTKGITQEKLAQLCCVSGAAISKWENEQSYPDIATLPILARIFHITIDELLNFEQDLTPEDVDHLINELLDKFTQSPFEEAMKYCKTLIYTYPNSELLKLKIAGMNLQLRVLLYPQAHGQQLADEFEKYAKQLCLQVTDSKDLMLKQSACILMTTYYSMDEKPEEALKLLQDIPTLSNTVSIESSLYLQMEEYDKAQELLQKQLYADSTNDALLLFSLIGIAFHKKEPENAKSLLALLEHMNEALHLSSSAINTCYLYYAKLKDKENTLRLLERFLEQVTSMPNMFQEIQNSLQNTPWFSTIKLKENQISQQGMKSISIEMLDTIEDLDFLHEDEDYKKLVQRFAKESTSEIENT